VTVISEFNITREGMGEIDVIHAKNEIDGVKSLIWFYVTYFSDGTLTFGSYDIHLKSASNEINVDNENSTINFESINDGFFDNPYIIHIDGLTSDGVNFTIDVHGMR